MHYCIGFFMLLFKVKCVRFRLNECNFHFNEHYMIFIETTFSLSGI